MIWAVPSFLAEANTNSSRLRRFIFALSFDEKYISSFSCAIAQIPEVTATRESKIDFVFIVTRITPAVNNVNLINSGILLNRFLHKENATVNALNIFAFLITPNMGKESTSRSLD